LGTQHRFKTMGEGFGWEWSAGGLDWAAKHCHCTPLSVFFFFYDIVLVAVGRSYECFIYSSDKIPASSDVWGCVCAGGSPL